MFTEALFIIAKTWKQPKCSSTDDWGSSQPRDQTQSLALQADSLLSEPPEKKKY